MSRDSGRGWQELPPVGHYLASEVGALAGVSGGTIGQWKRAGYLRASQRADEYPFVYSYQDVGEAMVVHTLIERSVRLSDLRPLIAALRMSEGTNWPLQHAQISVAPAEDRGRVVVEEDGDEYDVTEHRYAFQRLIPADDLVRIALDLNRGGWAAASDPTIEHIEVHPQTMSGRPVVRGTRVLATKAGAMARSDRGRRVLRDEYGLSDSEIDDAARWFRSVESYEADLVA